ncbi:UDP-2,3-diacylglucosamine diphosphatase [Bacteroidales bacterium OttesenSCG-928-M11]|nr:UDP-2,3-diacylglucosamine diphosphatase [Bacteroidales bacterium OttesenSCG-928-M11]
MANNKIYFASDLHLGSDVYENPIETEKRFVRWLDSIKNEASALYLLGDIFDFWFEYKKVVPRGFSRFFGKIAELSDSGIEIHFFTGNHDIWMYDYFPKELGVIVHREPVIVDLNGKKFYLAHGDGLGDESRSFKIIRTVFRNRLCQFLFASLPTNWGVGFAHRWSRHNRKKHSIEASPYFGEDKEHLVLYAKQYLQTDPSIDFFVFGHRHIMLDLQLNPKSRIVVLGDWMLQYSYALLDGQEMSLEIFED